MVVGFIDKLINDYDFQKKFGKVVMKILLVIAAVMLVNMLLAAAFAAISFLAIPILIAVAIGALLVVLWKRYADPITSVVLWAFDIIVTVIDSISKALDDIWPFADGGVTKNTLSLVGERGPELVNLPKGSRVYSNSDSKKMVAGSGGGGGNVINITINAKDTSKAEMRRIANELGNMINNKMNRSGSHRTMG